MTVFEKDRIPLMHPGEECEHLRDLDAFADPHAKVCEECGAKRAYCYPHGRYL
jgi:hypothetical protein